MQRSLVGYTDTARTSASFDCLMTADDGGMANGQRQTLALDYTIFISGISQCSPAVLYWSFSCAIQSLHTAISSKFGCVFIHIDLSGKPAVASQLNDTIYRLRSVHRSVATIL